MNRFISRHVYLLSSTSQPINFSTTQLENLLKGWQPLHTRVILLMRVNVG
jgi:hypothetical protein